MCSLVAEPALGAYVDRTSGAAARTGSDWSASDWKSNHARGQGAIAWTGSVAKDLASSPKGEEAAQASVVDRSAWPASGWAKPPWPAASVRVAAAEKGPPKQKTQPDKQVNPASVPAGVLPPSLASSGWAEAQWPGAAD